MSRTPSYVWCVFVQFIFPYCETVITRLTITQIQHSIADPDRKKRSSFGQMKLLECFLKVKCKETYRAISREGRLKCFQIAYSPGLYWDWETLIQQFWFWPETNIIEISQQINYKLYLLCLRHTNILFFYWWTISKKRKPLMKGILDPVGTFQIVKQ